MSQQDMVTAIIAALQSVVYTDSVMLLQQDALVQQIPNLSLSQLQAIMTLLNLPQS